MSQKQFRQEVWFDSNGSRCAAWHYPGSTGACVVMAGGLGVTKEPATDRFAARFHDAGHSVLAFDFRHFGESDGTPRQVVSLRGQQDDYVAAATFARSLPEVDPARLALWGFSLSGGHVFAVAPRIPDLAAAIVVVPLADGIAAAPNAFRHMTPLAMLRLQTRATLDAVGALLGRDPLLIPLAGRRGSVAALTTPDAMDAAAAMNADDYPDWIQAVAARSALGVGLYRPGRRARQVECPLLVVAAENDTAALPGPAVKAGRSAPRGQVVMIPGGHYAALLDAHELAVQAQVKFLGDTLQGDAAVATATALQTAIGT